MSSRRSRRSSTVHAASELFRTVWCGFHDGRERSDVYFGNQCWCDNESMFGKRYEPQLKCLLRDVVRVAVNRKLRREHGLGAFKSCLSVNLPSYHENLCMLDGDEVRKTTYVQ